VADLRGKVLPDLKGIEGATQPRKASLIRRISGAVCRRLLSQGQTMNARGPPPPPPPQRAARQGKDRKSMRMAKGLRANWIEVDEGPTGGA